MKNLDQLRVLFQRLGVVADFELMALAAQVVAKVQTAPDKNAMVKTLLRRALDDSPRVVQGILEDGR